MSESLPSRGSAGFTLPEKIQLVQDIWDQIAAEVDGQDLSPAQLEELDRRLLVYRAGEMSADTWDNVKARIRAGKSPGHSTSRKA